jgi:hypothetical protein
MQFGMDVTQKSFQNLVISYRGSERQPPNCLQLCLRFSRLMEIAEADGRHQASMGTEERVRAIVAEFHENSGLANKHHMDEDKIKSIINLICGSCPDPGIGNMLSPGLKIGYGSPMESIVYRYAHF